MVALLDGAEREHARPASRPAASLVELAGYYSELRVDLVVVAVAHRRDGPSSSATTSTVERAVPSSAVQCPVTLADRHVAAPIGVLAILTGQVLSGEDSPA
jgi:hypothetical protein